MRRHLLSFLTVCFALLLSSVGAKALDFTVGSLSYYTSSETEVILGDCTSAIGDVLIPSTVTHSDKTYNVTAIDEFAFASSEITSVSIPESVVSIGMKAFYGCTNLTNISFSTGLISIGNQAFAMCTALEEINLPANLTNIGDAAFFQCMNLKSIYANMSNPSGVSIGDFAFMNIASEATLYVPSSAKAAYEAYEVWNSFTIKAAKTAGMNTITIAAVTNGTLETDPAAEAAEGDAVLITATPSDGYRLKEGSLMVYKTGDESTPVELIDNEGFEMPAYDVTVSAVFEQIKIDVIFTAKDETTGSAIADATITIDGQEYTTDSNGNVGISLAIGNHSCTVVKDGYVTIDNSVTIDKETDEIIFKLSKPTYDITIDSGENGSVSVEKASFCEGDEVVITITPAKNYRLKPYSFDAYKTNEVLTGVTIENNRFTMPAYGVTISAEFELDEYNVQFEVLDKKDNAEVTGATINIDGKTLTTSAYSFTTAKLLAGEYNYTVGKTGYKPITNGTLTITDGTKQTIYIEQFTYEVIFRVNTEEESNENIPIVITDVTTLYTNESGMAVIYLPEGKYTYTISLEGYDTVSAQIDVSYGQTKALDMCRPRYNITIDATENGLLSTEEEYGLLVGEEVAITIEPSDGYRLKAGSLKVFKTGDESTTVAVADNVFNMPAYNVTITAEFEKQTGTANASVASEMVSIFPNPASEYVRISTAEAADVAIYNAAGMQMYSGNTEGETTINVSNYPAGVYFVKVGNQKTVRLLIKH